MLSSLVRNVASVSRTSVEVPTQRTRMPSAGVWAIARTSHSSSRTTTWAPGAISDNILSGVATGIGGVPPWAVAQQCQARRHGAALLTPDDPACPPSTVSVR
jgi:hypothetical protein